MSHPLAPPPMPPGPPPPRAPRARPSWVIPVATFAAGVAAGFGLFVATDNDSPQEPIAAAPASAMQSPRLEQPQAAAGPTGQLTAEDVAHALAGRGLPLTLTTVFDERTDPNSLLGRPSGYTSKVAFADPRVPEPERSTTDPADTRNGGGIEVYPTEDGATQRAQYVRSVSGAFAFTAEYTYQRGNVVLRISNALLPDQAAEYDRALAEILGT